MPELPEVHTTATILNSLVVGKKIVDAWSDYDSPHYLGKENIKDVSYFKKFRSGILNKKITGVGRRAKNVLIDIQGGETVVIHMKMTGHLLYGKFNYDSVKKEWVAKTKGPLRDPFNRFIHFVLTFADGTNLAFSDMRKFATVTLAATRDELEDKFRLLGPEPLEDSFDWKILKSRLLKRPRYKTKTALMDQSLVVGIGNIYSDEILWSSKIHPERTVLSLSDSDYKLIVRNAKNILTKGIDFGGDSMSDYRNPYGLPGEFQLHHNAYRRTKQPCRRKACSGIIERKVIGGRSAHFCPVCQK